MSDTLLEQTRGKLEVERQYLTYSGQEACRLHSLLHMRRAASESICSDYAISIKDQDSSIEMPRQEKLARENLLHS